MSSGLGGGALMGFLCHLLQLSERDRHVVRHGRHHHQVHLARQGACARGDPHQVCADVTLTAPQGRAGTRVQKLGTDPPEVPSQVPEKLHVAARSSQEAASPHVLWEQAVKERRKACWRRPVLVTISFHITAAWAEPLSDIRASPSASTANILQAVGEGVESQKLGPRRPQGTEGQGWREGLLRRGQMSRGTSPLL